ncbi:type II toxin-antitoxin system RelE/ParE family toxin [Desulfonatronospira sp.]|uniref:type II toxin-antitoxin system RelE/ParE family toxin n=1 Tax=Desulfonatronospira sp. TaxID=1962951 RepID=UPI00341CB783
MKLRFTDRALGDLEMAFDWYESQFPGLGLEFLDCIEEKIRNIQDLPQTYPVHHGNFRRALVRRFPFSIFYTIEEQVIVLHAVFDNRQSPDRYP